MTPMHSLADCEAYIRDKAAVVEGELLRCMDALDGTPEPLREAMAYSLLAGGKRIRAALLLAADEMTGGDGRGAMPFACAIEMIHAYSLVHDDLPAMDNDTLRRGKPTNHVVYGEAQAILAGDGLLNLAYEVLLEACASGGPGALRAARLIASAAGSRGMVGGQCLDIAATGRFAGEDTLREMHEMKTGALLQAAVLAGAALNNPDDAAFRALAAYGCHLGMLFQITYDMLDCTGTAGELGKSAGKDGEASKTTYVTLYGLARARELAREQAGLAIQALDAAGGADFFRLAAQTILERKK